MTGEWVMTSRGGGMAHRRNDECENCIPVVVIEPEDREQVERLTTLLLGFVFSLGVDAMQAALREFANPTPPRPPEPTGLGAVVEDDEGHKWTRANSAGEWFCECGDDIYETWSAFRTAVRVLSEGVVTP